MSTIKSQILSAIETRLADIKTTNGYNMTIATIGMVRKTFDAESELPATAFFPGIEESDPRYSNRAFKFPISLQSMAVFGATNPAIVAEMLLGDMKEVLTGPEWTLAFTSGGTVEPEVGDTVTGATSKVTAYITGVTVSTGAWETGDAAGTFTMRRKTGTFQAENLNIGANLNVCTITGDASGTEAKASISSLIKNIRYTGGGTEDWPEDDQTVVGCKAEFEIEYETNTGDPYH